MKGILNKQLKNIRKFIFGRERVPKPPKTMEEVQRESMKYLQVISNQYNFSKVVMRGLITGIFTGIGATIGFGVLLFVTSRFITSLKEVPLVDEILRQTELDVIIEAQKNYLTQGYLNSQNSSNNNTIEYLNYENENLGIKFIYPSSFNSIKEESNDGVDDSIIINFRGEKLLQELKIYKNTQVIVSGDKVSEDIINANISDTKMNIFEKGAEVNGVKLLDATFVFEFTKGADKYQIIAIGEKDSPKLSREVCKKILESIE